MNTFRAETISDIHINLWKYTPDQLTTVLPRHPTVPNLILAGDIGDPDEASLYSLLHIAKERYQRVIYVSGNHEFYAREPGSKKIPASVLGWFDKLDTQWDNFHFFYRRSEVYDGVRIVGATCWSSSPKDTEWSKLISEEGRKDVDFIEKELLHSKEPAVVVTHYPSTLRVLQANFANKITQYDYAQDLERMYHYPVKTWIFGHVHQKHDFTLPYSSSLYGSGHVRIICNPYGYPSDGITCKIPLQFAISNGVKSPDDKIYQTLRGYP